MRECIGPAVDVIAQRGADLGERMACTFEDVFRLGAESVVVIGSDLPDLPVRLVEGAFAALRRRQDGVVLGPAADGGYYLIGMNRLHRSLFREIDWSTGDVLAQTLEAARARSLDVRLLDIWRDVDDAPALESVVRYSRCRAHRTCAWVEHHRPAAERSATAAQNERRRSTILTRSCCGP
jgi:hypothetical protein